MSNDIFETKEEIVVQRTVIKSSIFTTNLTEARKNVNMTLAEVGNHFNSSHTRVTNWESGLSVPKIRDLVALCKLYKTTPNKLLGFDNE